MSSHSCGLGLRVKTGWAAVVLLAGPDTSPRVVDSRVIELSDPDVADSRQPYHAGFGTAQTDTSKVARLVKRIEQFSRRALTRLLGEYRKQYRVRGAGIVVPSLTDPATIANPHMHAHASEGRLFRTVVVDGLSRGGINARVVLEREVYEQLGKALRRPASRVKLQVAALGDATTPWRAEQKVAAAAAWLMLAGA